MHILNPPKHSIITSSTSAAAATPPAIKHDLTAKISDFISDLLVPSAHRRHDIISMCFGLLYPAYCSYKAVKTKNVKEYVHWMMYWIVFSIFSFFEVFVDIFIGFWLPFYYELKILFILWMLSPTTRGGSVLYRRVIHPMFTRHEHEIDAYLADFKLHASNLLVRWGTSAFHYITEMIMSTILRAGAGEHPFFKQSKRSFSLDGFDEQDMNRNSHQLTHDDNQGMYSDTETAPNLLDESESPQRRQIDRIGSAERDMNRCNVLPKPYSMMNLGMDEDDAQPPKLRSSSRKKKEGSIYGTIPRSTAKNNRRQNKT
ncbi:hypothetical protein Ocin01_02273 [Orchesella cincta]|uniref:Receptor expression-enhancing protein n=1 Tax=Orchesella cincta TaxID=48709 RepID=A0A1D2NGP2_ORCCI|nr:hypothetical protein Ocin01_02273 [Orchesella cincta]